MTIIPLSAPIRAGLAATIEPEPGTIAAASAREAVVGAEMRTTFRPGETARAIQQVYAGRLAR